MVKSREDRNAYFRERRAKNREKLNAYNREWRAKNKERISAYNKRQTDKRRAWNALNAGHKVSYNRDIHHLRKYGITYAEFECMVAAQNYKCAICQTTEPGGHGWVVDHCHATNTVRKILCQLCNIMLGSARDNVEILQRAIAYLQETQVAGGMERNPKERGDDIASLRAKSAPARIGSYLGGHWLYGWNAGISAGIVSLCG